MTPRVLLRVLIIGALLWSECTHAKEQPLEPEVLAFLQQQQQPLPFAVDFEQQRTIQGLPRALLSSGTLTVAADKVVWHTKEPLDQRLVITATGIQPDGEAAMRGSAVIAQLLLAVLQGDAEAIDKNFSVQLAADCLTLTPKLEQLQQFVQAIESCGNSSIERIQLIEQQGNRSSITFHYEAYNGVDAH
ncbi:outer membrane lipoprotein carrier protein LolA [Pseudidiomarina homiensis]|uniref:outer membrane lipoprotein carrier protein LolA n=1 Tax=Pseudidiomarina homiensis TaxID=364198 RepID=UPI00215A5BED|nr:outer membrane lipoprotein carrier protein LolA [Pseudidiomarina homiensis]